MQSPASPPREEITADLAATFLNVQPARIRQLIHEKKLTKAGYRSIRGKVHVMVYKDEIEQRNPSHRKRPAPERWF